MPENHCYIIVTFIIISNCAMQMWLRTLRWLLCIWVILYNTSTKPLPSRKGIVMTTPVKLMKGKILKLEILKSYSA